MIPLKSSNLKGYDYYADSHRLVIYFISGAAWNYYNINPDLIPQLAEASSPGGFFHSHIKGRHKERKIDPDFDPLYDAIEGVLTRQDPTFESWSVAAIINLRQAQKNWLEHLPPTDIDFGGWSEGEPLPKQRVRLNPADNAERPQQRKPIRRSKEST